MKSTVLAASAGALFTMTFGAAHAASNTWTGATNTNWDISTANWTSPTAWANGNDAIFGASLGPIQVVGSITANSVTLGSGSTLNINSGNTLQISRATASAPPWASITGAGTLRLTTAATFDYGWGAPALPVGFTGTLQVDKGRINGGPASLGGTTKVVINNGAQFLAYDGSSSAKTFTQDFSIKGMGYDEPGQNDGALRVSGLDASFSGGITLTGDAGVYTQATGVSSKMTLSGTISDSGSGYTLTAKANVNQITISGIIAGATKVVIGAGNVYYTGASSNTSTGNTTFATNGQLILSKTGGAVAVAGDLVMAAPGTRGIVSTTQDNQFGPNSVLRFASSGDTRLELKGTTQTLAGIDNTGFASRTFHCIQHSEFGAPAAVDSISDLVLNVSGSNSYTYDGVIRDMAGTVRLTKTGTGTQILSGSSGSGSEYTGGTIINNGTLVLGHASNTLANTGTVTVDGSGATLSLGSNSDTVGAVSLKNGASITGTGGTLTGSSYALESGTVSAKLGGSGAIAKSTAGSVTLTGNSSAYSGAVSVSAGTLLVNGSLGGASSSVSVTGGTLGGSGTVGGATTIGSGGTLAPGNSPGDLSFTSTLGLNGTLNMEITGIGAGQFDRLVGDGGDILTLGGILNLNNTGYTPVVGDTITLFVNWSGLSGSFTTINGTDLGGGFSWDTGMLATNGTLKIVPEPNASALLLGGLGALALLRRRR